MLLVNKIIAECERSSVDWRRGASGGRSFKIEPEDYHICGWTELVEEAKSLETQGLIKIEWIARGHDVKRILFRVENLHHFYELARANGQSNIWTKQEKVDFYQVSLEAELEKGFSKTWIQEYYQWLLTKVLQGDFSSKVEKFLENNEKYFACFRGIDELEQPIYKRLFSKKYLKNSKVFENELEDHVVAVARQYWAELNDNMDKTTILSQLLIEEYSQSLELKGPLQILLRTEGEEHLLDFGKFVYGITLNSEMLQKCVVTEEQEQIRKIVTIENKANFVMTPYDPNTLYIFSHGYFSPKEMQFLKQLNNCLTDVEYYHSGDLDYGGICIFRFIKEQVFPDLKPYMMNAEVFEKYQHYGETAKSTTLEKMKKLDVPELQGVIAKILETGMTIEQECFMLDDDGLLQE